MPTVSLTEAMSEYLNTDAAFRKAMLLEIVLCLLAAEVDEGTSLLRRYIVATVGFDALESALDRPAGSLRHALAAGQSPLASDLFAVLAYFERTEGIALDVIQRAA